MTTYANVTGALASLSEFSRESLRRAHCVVVLPSGRACRVLGAPVSTDEITITHVRGQVYRAARTALGEQFARASSEVVS